jgi:hypothetical protein
VAAGKRANEKEGTSAGYQLGDLEIAPGGRQSGERPVERAQAAQLPPAAPANANAPAKRAGTPRNLTLGDGDLAGPALELDLGPVHAPKPAATRASAPTKPGAAPPVPAKPGAAAPAPNVALSFGESSLGDDFEDGTFAKLPSLDVEQVERRSPAVAARETTPQAAKTKQSAEASELELTRSLADFGDVPHNLIASVSYALNVTRRLFLLRGERAAVAAEVQRSAHEHNTALAAMGQALMALSSQPQLEPLRSKVARVFDERAKVDRAGVQMEKAREDNQRAEAALEQEATALRQKLEPYLAQEREAAEAQRRADEEVRRAQAMQKRIEIELRALNEASESPDLLRLSSLNLQLDERRAVVAGLSGKLAAANETLGQARRELALQRGALDAVEERRKRLQSAVRAKEAEVQGHKRAADGALDGALRELAEAARQQKMDALVPQAASGVSQSEAALNEVGTRLVRFDRALTLYDRGAVIKGYGLLLAIVGGLIAVSVLR